MVNPFVPGAKTSGGTAWPVTEYNVLSGEYISGMESARSTLFMNEKYMYGAPPITKRHGARIDETSR